jgi:hypothetical protein
MVAAFMLVLIAMLALVIDNGALQRERRLAQAAADAGARAAADEVYRHQSASDIEAAAKRETTRNGFTDGTNATVTVVYPTTSVNAAGSNFVRVVVERSVGMNFASMLGMRTATVRVQAVGGMGSANSACLTITDTVSANALYVKAGNLKTIGCAIMVNSRSANAITTLASPSVIAPSVAVVGGPDTKPIGIPGPYSAGVPLPPGGPDPLSSLAMPEVGACNGAYGAYQDFTGTTLSPGVYCGGISIKAGTVTMSPGLYILAGGGLYLKNVVLTGTGVTIVNTNAPTADGGAANFGVPNALSSVDNSAIEIETNSDVRLSAMTTGSLAGVLFYGDPSAGVSGVTYTNYLYSSSDNALQGAVYFPTERLQAKSHSNLTLNGAVVVQGIQIDTGNENITINGPPAGSTYYGLTQPTVIE